MLFDFHKPVVIDDNAKGVQNNTCLSMIVDYVEGSTS